MGEFDSVICDIGKALESESESDSNMFTLWIWFARVKFWFCVVVDICGNVGGVVAILVVFIVGVATTLSIPVVAMFTTVGSEVIVVATAGVCETLV